MRTTNWSGSWPRTGARCFATSLDFAMDMSFDTAMAKLAATTGVTIPKRQLGELTATAAVDYFDFYDERQARLIESEEWAGAGKIQVLTSDGKGIVMRKKAEDGSGKLQTRLSPGEKCNRKRMAEVATVYDLRVQPRSIDDVLPRAWASTEDAPPRPMRPRAANKRF